jgi:hypothetical protein
LKNNKIIFGNLNNRHFQPNSAIFGGHLSLKEIRVRTGSLEDNFFGLKFIDENPIELYVALTRPCEWSLEFVIAIAFMKYTL